MNTKFKVIVLTRLGFKPESSAPEQTLLPLDHPSLTACNTFQRNNASKIKLGFNFFDHDKHINFLDHQILLQKLKNATRFGVIPPSAQRRFNLNLGVHRDFSKASYPMMQEMH